MKKGLIIVPNLQFNDGISTVMMNYYYEIVKKDWKIDFLVLKDEDTPWKSDVIKNSGNVFCLPPKSKYSKETKEYIKTIVKENGYDIIHVNIPGEVARLTLCFAKKYKVKTRIFHCHNPKNNLNMKAKVSTFIYDNLCLKKANRFIACSKSTGISRFKNRKFYILKNVIDTEHFIYSSEKRVEIRNKLDINDKIVIGVVGRFTMQKNPYFLVDCFTELCKKNEKYFLLWIGEGEEKTKIEEKLISNGLKNKFCFPGKKSDVGNWYCAMDIFFLPSKFEGLGIVFLEAQCSGLTCVASDTVPKETEITELMNKYSLSERPSIWADKINKLCENMSERKNRAECFMDVGYTHESSKMDMLKLYEKFRGGIDANN